LKRPTVFQPKVGSRECGVPIRKRGDRVSNTAGALAGSAAPLDVAWRNLRVHDHDVGPQPGLKRPTVFQPKVGSRECRDPARRVVAAAGMPDGDYSLGGVPIRKRGDRVSNTAGALAAVRHTGSRHRI
jgi:hypothetical protein